MQGVTVVTGASAGIGKAIATRLLDEGRTVIALQRRPPRLKHDRLLYREVDLADVGAATSVTDEVAARYPLRYLVNNAGANRPALLEQATTDAPMILIKGFAPAMRKAGFGRIVSMSSRAVLGKTQRTVSTRLQRPPSSA
ncbi:MAG: SDR family NAD(P)-dependent oxidoreductase [Vulcanimicrobiaceae bacterium]